MQRPTTAWTSHAQSDPLRSGTTDGDLEVSRKRLAALIERHAPRDGRDACAIPRLTLQRRMAPAPTFYGVIEPSLSIIAQGSISGIVGHEPPHTCDSSTYVLTSLDLPIAAKVEAATPEAPYLHLLLRLPIQDIASMLAEGEVPEPLPFPTDAGLARWQSPLTPALMDAVVRLASLLDEPVTIPFLAPAREREILYLLLCGEQGGRLRRIVGGGTFHVQVVAAIDRMREALTEELYVDALAASVGMSATTFRRHFKALTTLSPIQYQKILRLQQARRLILGLRLPASEAALAVGYRSASQFSRDYRRAYGSSPRQDIRRTRV